MQMKKTYLPGQRIYYAATALLLLGLLTAIVCDMGNWQFALSSPCFLNRYCHLKCRHVLLIRLQDFIVRDVEERVLHLPLYMESLCAVFYIIRSHFIWQDYFFTII